MDAFWHEITAELGDSEALLRVGVRLFVAMLVGGLIGIERERVHQPAGLRTHVLVCVAAALFVMAMRESSGTTADLSRVVQGIATGIGFIGAGTILKHVDSQGVSGLTTAASVWLCAALGSAIGLGRIWLPLLGSFFGWLTLWLVRRLELYVEGQRPDHDA